MKKNLPEIFKNTINKTMVNNENIYYSANNKIETEKDRKTKNNNIKEKLNKIFTSPSYVYKAQVKITTKDKSFSTRIIGRNKKYLITIDNQTIPIEAIIDIENE